jgi:hypothetical protein
MKNKTMSNRFATGIALLCMTLPLTACGGGDDDSSNNSSGGTPGSGGSSSTGGSTNSGGAGAVGGSGGGGGASVNAWIGHTYLLAMAKGDWSEPRGIGKDLFGVAPAFILKIGGSGDNLTATLATGPGAYAPDPSNPTAKVPVTPAQATQEPCGPTTQIPFSGSAYPNGTISADTLRVFIKNDTVTPPLQVTGNVYNLKLTNVLPNGSTTSTTGTLEATMDFQDLYLLFQSLGPGRTPQSVCSAFSSNYTPSDCAMGDPSCTVSCQPCPGTGSPTCLTVKATEIGAVEASSLVVTDVVEASRPATCADSPKP